LLRTSLLSATLALVLAACSSSSSTGSTSSSSGGSSGTPPVDGGTPTDSGTVTTPTKGLTISNATVASLDGTYDIQVVRLAAPSGGGFGFNGNFDSKVEIEIDTDASGAVLAAHFWNYQGTAPNLSPDKYYGCDQKATPCTGVKVDIATNIITLSGPTWPEVTSPSFDGSAADVLVSGGAKVTVSGEIQATVQ
jgi:hypothetical protein